MFKNQKNLVTAINLIKINRDISGESIEQAFSTALEMIADSCSPKYNRGPAINS